MRIGSNPEKEKFTKILYKKHRVIIPVYIPDSKDGYFNNLFDVFKASINSLLSTINVNDTNISIINNNCKHEVTDYINNLLEQKLIDKHIVYKENYGKVFSILSEARASYEDFISIADADVFYFNGWENKVFTIFNSFYKAGVVSPVPAPYLAFYNNVSLFGNLFKLPKKGNVVAPNSFKYLEEGINNPNIFHHKKYDWKKEQFHLKKNNTTACVGCGHFVATYRNIFKNFEILQPKYVFKDGDENYYLDSQFDKLGYSRLSTLETKAYHLGNTVPTWVHEYVFEVGAVANTIQQSEKLNSNSSTYLLKKIIFKILKKINII
ncbi:glycosyltransferase family A protein [Bacteroidota bacterium]